MHSPLDLVLGLRFLIVRVKQRIPATRVNLAPARTGHGT